MIRLFAVITLAVLQFGVAQAQSPRVVTDIAPVHSLASIVMQGVGTPEVLLPPGASPHDFALRPSDARDVSRAEVIIWIGADFTPWLERSIEALAPDAHSLQLIDVPETFTLQYRKGAVFGRPDASAKAQSEPDHSGDDHDDDHADENEHRHTKSGKAIDHHGDHGSLHRVAGEPDHHGHAHHGDVELHAWQDPENAKTWLAAIAELLTGIDPGNADRYRDNAEAAAQDMDALTEDLRQRLQPVRDRGFVVMHDAYHYFEHRFGVEAAAAILPGDGGQASAARVQAISQHMHELGPTCIFIEPQMSDRLAQSLASEHDASVGTLDPIGDSLQRGPGLYTEMMRGLGQGLLDCLG